MTYRIATLADTPPTKPSGIFTPTSEQQRLKSKFWLKYLDQEGGRAGDQLSLPAVLRVVTHRDLGKWWNDLSGFSEWFLEDAEYRHRADYLSNLALNTLEEVLLDKTAAPQARLAAVKLALEAAGKTGKSAEPQEQKDQVGQMTREQLVEFITRTAKKLPSVRKQLTLDVESDSIKTDGKTTDT